MTTSRLLSSVLHLAAFLALSLAWMLGLGLLVASALRLAGIDPSADPARALGGMWTGVLTMVQIAGLAALAVGGALLLPGGAPSERLAAAFPLPPRPRMLIAGLVGGLSIWTLPSWIAEQLMAWLDGPSMPELLFDLLREGSLVDRLAIAAAIGISAPLCEEIVFRGYLWRVFEAGGGRLAALFGTTVLFAVYHLDPVQSVALLPTALLLGWLRARSGSLLPPLAAHLANNGLGLALTLGTEGPEAQIGLPLALGGIVVALAAAWIAARGSPPPDQPEEGLSSSST